MKKQEKSDITIPSKKRTILIADDAYANRAMLLTVFSPQYNVLEAENGVEALRILRDERNIAALILDIMMPEMDGHEVLAEMRKEETLSQIPVIVVTANGEEENQLQTLERGAQDVIIKPFSPQIILRRLENILAQRDATLANEKNKILEEQLYLTSHDNLTGLLNRNAFVAQVREMIDHKPMASYVISCLDIDRFKVVNDRFGHAEGDKLLKFIADTQLPMVELHSGIICRDMADVFLTLLPNDEAAISEITDNFFGTIRDYGLQITVDVHIGRYVVADKSLDVNQMIDRAMLAMRSVKGLANEHVGWFDEKMLHELLRKQELVDEMRPALESGQFVLYFQPQYDYAGGRLSGAEALVRWRHPEKGMISPGEFIALFEENGFITNLDQFVWEQTCHFLRKWTDAGLNPVPVSVNVSRRDIRSLNMPELLSALVEKYELDPHMLHLEVTESAYVDQPEQLISVIRELQSNGFLVEMDDFGSGYSSLNTLKDVPVDILKLDMKFSSETGERSRAGSILSSVVRMAHWLKLPVVAEGVETAQQANYLKSIGCHIMQGYHFAKPMSAEEYERLLANADKSPLHGQTPAFEGVEGVVDFLDASTQATLLFNSFMGGAQIVELDGDRLESLRANDRFYELMGTTRERYERWRLNLFERFYPESRNLLRDALERAYETGDEASAELHSLPLEEGGGDFWTMTRVRFLAQNGWQRLYYITSESITERKALDELRVRLDDIVRNVPAGIAIYEWREAFYPIYVSDKMCALFGYSPEEYNAFIKSGRPVGPIPGISLSSMRPENVTDGYPAEEVTQATRRDGSKFWLRFVYSVVKRDGRPPLVYTTMVDITRLHNDEQEAKTRKRELEMALNASSLYFWTFDLISLTYTDANRNAAALGVGTLADGSKSSMLTTGCFAPDGITLIREHIDRFYKDPDASSDGSLVVHMNKQVCGMEWMRISYAVVRDDTGMARSVSFVGEDVSEKVENERMYTDALVGAEHDAGGASFAMLLVDLSQDIVESAVRSVFSQTGKTYTEGLAGLCSSIYLPNQRAQVAEQMSIDAIVKAFQNGQSVISLDYQRTMPGEILPRWVRTTVKTFREPVSGRLKSLHYSADIDREVTDRQIASVLARSNFELLSLIYVDSGYMRCYQHSALEEKNEYGVDCLYADGIRDFTGRYIAPELKEKAIEELGIDGLVRRLKTANIVSVIYPLTVDGTVHYKRWRFCWLNEDKRVIVMNRADVSDSLALQRRSEELHLALSSTNTAVCYYDVATRTLTMPDDYAAMLGRPVVMENIPYSAKIVAQGDMNPYIRFYERILAGETNGKETIQFCLADGSNRWFSSTFATTFDNNGKPVRAVVTVRDITQERNWEIENERNHVLLECTGIALIDYDVNTDTLNFETLRKGTGFYKKSYPNYYSYVLRSELVHPDSADVLRGVIEKAKNGAGSGTVEYRADNWGTGYRWCRLYYSYMTDESGKTYRVVGQITDIQEEKDREALIEKLRGSAMRTGFVNRYDANIVAQVFRYLYNNEADTPAAIEHVLALVGEQYGVSRAYICEDDPAHQYSDNTFEWCASGIEPQKDNLRHVSYEKDAPFYMEMFDETHTLFCPDVSKLPQSGRDILEPQGIRSMFHCAIMEGDVFRGVVGFDDCTGNIVWTEGAKGTLRLLSMLIGTFLLKYREHEGAAFTEDFMAALENNAEYIYIIDPDNYEVIYCNRAIRELFGRNYVGCRCYEGFLNNKQPCDVCPVSILRETGKSGAVETLRPSGVWLLAQASPLNWKGRQVIMLTCTDITKQKHAEAELQTRNGEYEAIVRQSGKRIIRYDLRTGAATSFFESGDGTDILQTVTDYPEEMIRSGMVAPESVGTYRGFYARMRAGEPSGNCNARVVRHGELRWNHADYTLIYDDSGAPTHSIVLYTDNTDEMNEREGLVSAAERDSVTGLYNRAAAERRIRGILDSDTGERCALLMLDLDKLKEINDTLGHAEGDRAIRLIAETMRRHFRSTDILGRAGGDEFIALLTNVSSAATLRGTMASFIRRLNGNSLGERADYPLNCSMGVAFGVAGQDGFDKMFWQADRALYHVKRNGKNDFAFYMPDMDDSDYAYAPHAGITLTHTEWYDAAEYRKLISALTVFYPLIISVNLTRNSYYMMEYAAFATHRSKDAGVYDELIESGASTFHPDDRQGFIDAFSRESVLRAYADRQISVMHRGRQLGDDHVYRWVGTAMVFVPDETTGDICGISFSHPVTDEVEKEAERMKLMKLLEFTVSASFEYICLLHTRNGQYELYSNDGHNTHTVPKRGDFNEITTEIMQEHIAPETRQAYYNNAVLQNVIVRMEETNGAYSYRYCLEDGEREAAFAWYEPTHTELLMTVRKL